MVLSAVTASAQDSFINTAQKNLDVYNDLYEPEYVDVYTDRDFYFAGERLWYSLHIRNNQNATGSMSLLAYVEIRGEADSVIIRQKIKCAGGRGHGDIVLPRQLATGYYKLTAYTLWMKNAGPANFFQELVPIVNTETPLILPQVSDKATSVNQLLVRRAEGREYSVDIPAGFRGDLVAFTNETVFFHQRIITGEPVQLSLEKIKDQFITIQLIDDQGKVVAGTELRQSPEAEILLTTQRKEIQPRSTGDLAIELRDKAGVLIPANLAVTIKPQDAGLVHLRLPKLADRIGNLSPAALPFKREVFIYPETKGAPRSIVFSSAGPYSPLAPALVSKAVTDAEMKAKTMKAYSVETLYAADLSYNIPANNSYEPSHYAPLPSIEEFIREVIPVVKVRKIKGEKVLLVRNADNPVNIYFFKKPALMLIDGAIIKSLDNILAIPLADIERIDVVWGTREINSLGIASLADNGVVVFQTKSRPVIPNTGQELFKQIHTPSVFAPPNSSKEKTTPRFHYPLYWNPDLQIAGKGKLSFVTGDDLGNIVLEVQGYTNGGEFVQATAAMRIVFPAE
jgi:hypothetical protein